MVIRRAIFVSLVFTTVCVDDAVAGTPLPFDPLSVGDGTGEELTRLGQEALAAGDAARAARIFTAAAAAHSGESTAAQNLATALATLGVERGDVALLCEALAAAELALGLGHGGAAELLLAIEGEMPEGACEAQGLPLPRAARRQLLTGGGDGAEQHVAMVRGLCATPAAISLSPTSREKSLGIWTAVHMMELWLLLRVCGVVAVEGVLDRELVARISADLGAVSAGAAPLGDSFKDTEAASRGGLRREVRLPLRPPFADPTLTAPPLVRSLLRMALGERVELDTFSCITSFPGSMDQAWHSDVPTPKTGRCHAPPVGLVAVAPLVEATARSGATEFLAGSHVHVGDDRFWMDDAGGATEATPHLQLRTSPGSLVLFDIRLRHRGRANRGDADRPVLYMSYVQEWFRDGINFRERQTRSWSGLPPVARRLFARVDAREYVIRLEEALRERGVDVGAMTSDASYRQEHLEL